MTASRDVVEEAVVAHVGRWFGATLTACKFASPAVSKSAPLVVLEHIDESTPITFDAHLTVAAERRKLALFILPAVDEESKLVDLVRTLSTRPEWTYSIANDDAGALVVDLRWKRSSVIGFGPFAIMPVTRRSPFTTLAAWPCGHDNRFRKKPAEFVGVGDMEHDYDEVKYKEWRSITIDAVRNARSTLPGGSSAVTGITFRLSKEFSGSL